MPCPVFLDNHAVIHGNFRGAVFEIGRRVAASQHHGPQKLIRFHECARRVVYELGLDRSPGLLEPVTISAG